MAALPLRVAAQPAAATFTSQLYKLGGGSKSGAPPRVAAAPTATAAAAPAEPAATTTAVALAAPPPSPVAAAAPPLPFSPASTVRSTRSDAPLAALGVEGESDAAASPPPTTPGATDDDELAGATDRSPSHARAAAAHLPLMPASPATMRPAGGALPASPAFSQASGVTGHSRGGEPAAAAAGPLAGQAALPGSPAMSATGTSHGSGGTPGSFFRPDASGHSVVAAGSPGGAATPTAAAAGARVAASSSSWLARTSPGARGGSAAAQPVALSLPSSPGGCSTASDATAASPRALSPGRERLRRVLSMRVPVVKQHAGLAAAASPAPSPAVLGGGRPAVVVAAAAHRPPVSSPLARDAVRSGFVSPASSSSSSAAAAAAGAARGAGGGAQRRALWGRAAAGEAVGAPLLDVAAAAAPAPDAVDDVHPGVPSSPATSAAPPRLAPGAPAAAIVVARITATTLSGSFPARHTEYTVEVALRAAGDAAAAAIHGTEEAGEEAAAERLVVLELPRRYREFHALHRSCASAVAGVDHPAAAALTAFHFPRKVLLRPTRPAVVAERRERLGELLRLLCAAAAHAPEVREALCDFCALA